jgi:hypothetical protein
MCQHHSIPFTFTDERAGSDMTRKDYETIAWTIRTSLLDQAARTKIVWEFATALGQSNPRFDEVIFARACIESWEEWYASDGRVWIGDKCIDTHGPDHLRHVRYDLQSSNIARGTATITTSRS